MEHTSGQAYINDRLKIIHRETLVIAEQLALGLEAMAKVTKNEAYYYQSFYAMSMGLERLMKLNFHIEQPEVDPYALRHNLKKLSKKLGVTFEHDPICNSILNFLTRFAEGSRYTIVDYLYDGNRDKLSKEPILNFYQHCIKPVLMAHPRKRSQPIPSLDELFFVVGIREDLGEHHSVNAMISHQEDIAHASRFIVMYMGRLLQPFILRLTRIADNSLPEFNRMLIYLKGDDRYFKSRKTFRYGS